MNQTPRNFYPMSDTSIGRREFVRLSLLASLSGLTGCGRNQGGPVLMCPKKVLPTEWLRALPVPWRVKFLKNELPQTPFGNLSTKKVDLLACGDGWLSDFQPNSLQPISSETLFKRLDYQARNFLAVLGPNLANCALPVGVSPWVMLFRNGKHLLKRARLGWDVLLSPELAGSVVLPASPRLVMSLAEKMLEVDALKRLRSQALTFDDRNGLNWVLSGNARVAVLPLNRCFRSLIRDPRLSVVLPSLGAPLDWTVLVRPTQTREPVPQAWIEQSWTIPLLASLLGRGWMPPLPRTVLNKALLTIPSEYRSIVLPPEDLWQKCWSLPPLRNIEKKNLEMVWRESTP